jgi:hypothetical protein
MIEGIDEGIRNLVDLINDLPGLKTVGSCEGHLEGTFNSPYVNIDIIDPNSAMIGLGIIGAALSHEHEAVKDLSENWFLVVNVGDWLGPCKDTNIYVNLGLVGSNSKDNLKQIELLEMSIRRALRRI